MTEHFTNDQLTTRGEEVETAALEAFAREQEGINRPHVGYPGTYQPSSGDDDPNRYKDIVTRFEQFHDPSSSYAKTMVIHLSDAMGMDGLSAGEMAAVGNLESQFGGEGNVWHGDAAREFDKFYLEPFDGALVNQKAIIAELATAMTLYEDVLKRRRADAMEIGRATIEALDSVTSSTASGVQLGLSLLGVLISIAAVPITGGGSATLTMALIAGGVGTIQAFASSVESISGATVDDIVGSMYTALDEVDSAGEYAAGEIASQLGDSLEEAQSAVEADAGSRVPALVPQEPSGGTPNVTSGDGGAIRGDGNLVPPA